MASTVVMRDQSIENVQLGAGADISKCSVWPKDSSGVPEWWVFGCSYPCYSWVLAGKHMYARGKQCWLCSREAGAYVPLQSLLATSHPVSLYFSFRACKTAAISIHCRGWCEDRWVKICRRLNVVQSKLRGGVFSAADSWGYSGDEMGQWVWCA